MWLAVLREIEAESGALPVPVIAVAVAVAWVKITEALSTIVIAFSVKMAA